jgi:hypothetical protein
VKTWSEADDEKILHLLSQGRTRRQISVYFGVTRNAICGRVHRLTKPEPRFRIEEAEPNAETIAAMAYIEAGGGEVFHGTATEAFAAILESPKEDPRIRHRRIIIRKLTRVLQKSTDEAARERILWMIETKQSEINCLLAVADCHADS